MVETWLTQVGDVIKVVNGCIIIKKEDFEMVLGSLQSTDFLELEVMPFSSICLSDIRYDHLHLHAAQQDIKA